MPLTNEQVIDSLLAFYQSRGTDLTYLINDPVFDKLPVQDKIEAIKKHAGVIHANSPSGWNAEEKAHLKAGIGMGVLGGIGTGMLAAHVAKAALSSAGPLASAMAANKATAAVLGFGALIGSTMGGVTGYLKARSDIDSRHVLRDQLGATARDPSNSNAIGVLSVRDQYQREHTLRHLILDKVQDKLGKGQGLMDKRLEQDWGTFYKMHEGFEPKP